MSFNYAGFVSELANLAGTTTTQPNFVIELPHAIDYAEQRCIRELDLISTITSDVSQLTSPNVRTITVPTAFIVVNRVNVITPAGSSAASGRRNTLVKASLDYLDYCWPDASIVGVPKWYAIVNQTSYAVGMWPDAGYVVEYVGTQRPAPLSASNPNTFLSTNLPDLMLVAAMIHMCAYQKNWRMDGDDPGAAVTYETQFRTLLTSADAEELRKRYAGTTVLPPPGEQKTAAAPDALKG